MLIFANQRLTQCLYNKQIAGFLLSSMLKREESELQPILTVQENDISLIVRHQETVTESVTVTVNIARGLSNEKTTRVLNRTGKEGQLGSSAEASTSLISTMQANSDRWSRIVPELGNWLSECLL